MRDTIMECPKCGKPSVVQSSNTLYQCIACDFQRDLAPSPEAPAKPDNFWLLLLGGAIALVIL